MRWEIAPKTETGLIAQILRNRGVTTQEQKYDFLHPSLDHTSAELSLPNAPQAADFIRRTIDSQQPIVIFGDYDVDGIAASAILYRTIKSRGGDISVFIPHRDRHGYGISNDAITEIIQSNPEAKLIITVDNGIVAIDQIEFAKQHGFSTIITDHHRSLSRQPDANYIIHSDQLCGASVAWCLARHLIDQPAAARLLQYVTLGTICDVIPLRGINRNLTSAGLNAIAEAPFPGLEALILECGSRPAQLTSAEIAFRVGPRLNAPGRVDSAKDALDLLISDDPIASRPLARRLSLANHLRQTQTSGALLQAFELLDPSDKIQVVGAKEWPSGVIGLVAAKISERFARPSLVFTFGQQVSKFSARSIPKVDLIAELQSEPDYFLRLGGHAGAAGGSIRTADFDHLKAALLRHFADIDIGMGQPVLNIDAEIDIDSVSLDMLTKLDKLQPTGSGNSAPIFVSTVRPQSIRRFGKKGAILPPHLGFRVGFRQCVFFNGAEHFDTLTQNPLVQIAYTPSRDFQDDTFSLRLDIQDIRPLPRPTRPAVYRQINELFAFRPYRT